MNRKEIKKLFKWIIDNKFVDEKYKNSIDDFH